MFSTCTRAQPEKASCRDAQGSTARYDKRHSRVEASVTVRLYSARRDNWADLFLTSKIGLPAELESGEEAPKTRTSESGIKSVENDESIFDERKRTSPPREGLPEGHKR